MAVTDKDLKRILGRKFDPSATYSVHDKPGGLAKLHTGTYKAVGKIQTSGDGDMVILQELPSGKPKQSVLSKLRGAFNDY